MNPNTELTSTSAVLAGLLEQCTSLCESASTAIQDLPAERENFLAHSLEGALQQLELILRVLDERHESPRDAERQGFLRRLFARSQGAAQPGAQGGDFGPPSFDVSQQGLQGNSWTVSLSELVSFLAFAQKTGVLWVDGPDENFLIGLADGKLMHATSDHTPEGLRLGEVLVGLGHLTRRQLERFLSKSPGGEAVSGEVLLDSGLISDEELEEALVHQIRQLFFRLINTRNAVFRFSEGMQIQLAYQVSLDINQLLLDSARAEDEVGHYAERAAAVMQEWNAWQQELCESTAPSTGKKAAARSGPTTSTRKPARPAPAIKKVSPTPAPQQTMPPTATAPVDEQCASTSVVFVEEGDETSAGEHVIRETATSGTEQEDQAREPTPE